MIRLCLIVLALAQTTRPDINAVLADCQRENDDLRKQLFVAKQTIEELGHHLQQSETADFGHRCQLYDATERLRKIADVLNEKAK